MRAVMIVLAAGLATMFATPVDAQQRTQTYVIVHGAWGGGWDWKQVDSVLDASGNKVYRPTLTGLGERVHLLTPEVDLTTHITDIVNVILFENLRDVVLVGHSYGGMVITGVADRVPDRIRRLVYVDALVPENGESVVTAIRATSTGDRMGPLLESAKHGALIPSWVKPGTTPPTDVPHPVKTFTQQLKLENPVARKIPGTYVLTVDAGKAEASDDFAGFGQRAKSRGWTYHVLQADHTPERSAVGELTTILRSVP